MRQFTASCPACHAAFTVDERHFGKTLHCQHCLTNFVIDAPEPDEAIVPAPAPYLPPPPAQTGYAPPAEAWAGYESAAMQGSTTGSPQTRPLGGLERAMIILGVCFVGIGLILNLLPLFNLQVPLFVEKGQLGQYIGVGMGLFGAFALALGIRRRLFIAGVTGVLAATVCCAVFGVSMYLKGDPDKAFVRSKNRRDSANAGLINIAIKEKGSPWANAWPEWQGFSKTGYLISPASDWSRHVSNIQGISVSLPGDCQGDTRQIKVGGRNADDTWSESSYENMTFRISTFRYPFEKRSDEEKFAEVQKAILKGQPKIEERRVGRFAAREFTIEEDDLGQHGLIVSVGDMIVVLRAEGEKTRIPGEASNKLIHSLIILPAVAADRSRDAQDALDPFALESKGGSLTGTAAVNRPQSSTSEVRLNRENAEKDKALQERINALVAGLETGIAEKASLHFPAGYLSLSAGYDNGEPVFLASPTKQPVSGIDMVFETVEGSTAFSSIVPVFDDQEECLVRARQGYALSGIRVNSSQRIEGLQFLFSKITDDGFEASDSYESEWYGTKPEGTGQLIDSGGKPVYGIWAVRTSTFNAIGLIREPQ